MKGYFLEEITASRLNVGECFLLMRRAESSVRVIRNSNRGNKVVSGDNWNGYEITIAPSRRVFRIHKLKSNENQ